MPDNKRKRGPADRKRVASKQDYELRTFMENHPHLTRAQAIRIIEKHGPSRSKCDAAAKRLKRSR